MILETKRLALREMGQADLPALAAILQDEQAMYAYGSAFTDEETQDWLDRQLTRYKEDGFGLWAVILKESGEMIGQAGITWQDVDGERVPEIGYLFNRACWGNGYAVEAAAACRQYAFGKPGLGEIYSIIRDGNIPSMNVAIRTGMVIRKRTLRHYRGVDMQHYVFSVRKSGQNGDES